MKANYKQRTRKSEELKLNKKEVIWVKHLWMANEGRCEALNERYEALHGK